MSKHSHTNQPRGPEAPSSTLGPPSSAAEGSLNPGLKPWQVATILVVVLLAVYWPALGGGVLWDDPAHMTKPEFRSLTGLFRIWFEPGATQQYYPLTYTLFWFQNLLFGQSTLAHHLVNLLLHGSAAMLLWLLLRDLRVPAAFGIALLWALHPVQVESVAWISEQKNTLSAVFYLAAFRCYLRFDRSRDRKPYLWAMGLFVAALASKTAVATLPGALLVVLWWQRGRLEWRRDLLPTLPFFLVGLVASRITSYIEWAVVGGAPGAEFDLSFAQRLIQAGRAAWFYAGKLAWPDNLMFIYPRWTLDAADPKQWLPLILGVAVLAGCWLVRRWSRAPLAAALLFIGTLLPALGFVNVYPFRFSYVADHFQYLAGVALVALVIGGGSSWLARRTLRGRPLAPHPAVIGLAVVLGVLSWRQSHLYGGDDIALYRETLERNPDAWIFEQNWGEALQLKGDREGALAHYLAALEIRPDLADVQFGAGQMFYELRRPREAVEAFAEGVRLWPWYAKGRFNYAAALAGSGERARAIAQFDTAAAIEADSVGMQHRVAEAYLSLGDTARAMAALNRAVRLGWRP